MDLQAPPVGMVDEGGIGDGHPSQTYRNLHTGCRRWASRHPPAPQTQLGYLPGARRGAQAGAEGGPDAGQATLGEGTHRHPVEGAGAADRVDERFDTGIGLGIDVEPGPGKGRQQVLHAGDSAPITNGGCRHLPPRQFGYGAAAVGDPVQARVVEGHQHAIAGDVYVGFEVAETKLHRRFKGLRGVLGEFPGPTPVGDGQRPGVIKVGEIRRGQLLAGHAVTLVRGWGLARWFPVGLHGGVIDPVIKRCLGQMAEGVQVVTASHKGVVRGYTSHWVTQVSFTEPVVMASVSPRHDTWPLMEASGRFAVSLLAGDQVEQGQYFSYPGRRFDRLLTEYLEPATTESAEGVDPESGPEWWVVAGAIAWLGCEVVAVHDAVGGGDTGVAAVPLDHRLVFARVVAVGEGRLREPALVYSSRQGWRVASERARAEGSSVRDELLARIEERRKDGSPS